MKKTFTTFTLIALAFTLSTVAFGQRAAGNRKAEKPGTFEVPPKTKGQRLAVLPFQNKTNNQSWHQGGAQAMQDVFVTELVKSGKFSVVEREQLEALLKKNNLALSGDVDPSTAVKVGKLLGVNYLLTGAVTESGNTDVSSGGNKARKRSLGMNVKTKLIDTSTGEIVWAKEARAEESGVKVSVGGFRGGVDDDRFHRLMKDCAQQIGQKIAAAADLSELVKTPRK